MILAWLCRYNVSEKWCVCILKNDDAIFWGGGVGRLGWLYLRITGIPKSIANLDA